MLARYLPFITAASAALTYKGVDWSSAAVEEDSGVSYSTADGTAQSLEKILASSGVNTIRQRIWVNPPDGNYDLEYNLALAKRADAAGLGVYLDLHFSDTWADTGNQEIPSGWPTDLDDLTYQLYNYTKDVSNQFSSAGITPKIISIGNESWNTNMGNMAPTGGRSTSRHGTALPNSAAWGVKDSDLEPSPQIMIHIANGWDWDTVEWYYSGILGAGALETSDFDIIGLSYYPFYSSDASLANLETSLSNAASKWGKGLVVAETNWPTSCPSPEYKFPSDTSDIPFSAEGQSTWVQRVAEVVAGVKNGLGLFYWEPAWLDNAALGSSCEYNTMFATSGEALSSLSTFSSL